MSEIERLRDRIEELEQVLGVGSDDVARYRNALGITIEQAKILGLLMRRAGTVTRASIFTVLFGARPDCDQPTDDKVIDVHVCKLRKPLRRLGVEIRPDWGFGYFITRNEKAALRAYLEAPPVEDRLAR